MGIALVGVILILYGCLGNYTVVGDYINTMKSTIRFHWIDIIAYHCRFYNLTVISGIFFQNVYRFIPKMSRL